MPNRSLVVFGLSSSRKDPKIVTEVLDTLDDYLEDEWEVVAWSRRSGTRFLIKANVEARGMISDTHLQASVRPVHELLEEVSESRVKWIIPEKVSVGTPAEMAERTVQGWLNSMWSEPTTPSGGSGDSEQVKKATPKVQDTPKETNKPAPSPKRIVEAEPKTASKESGNDSEARRKVLEAFGLLGNEVDSDGEPINMFVFSSEK